jgi:hypothetical protein
MFVILGFQSHSLTLIIVQDVVVIVYSCLSFCTLLKLLVICKNTECPTEVSFCNNFNIALKLIILLPKVKNWITELQVTRLLMSVCLSVCLSVEQQRQLDTDREHSDTCARVTSHGNQILNGLLF